MSVVVFYSLSLIISSNVNMFIENSISMGAVAFQSCSPCSTAVRKDPPVKEWMKMNEWGICGSHLRFLTHSLSWIFYKKHLLVSCVSILALAFLFWLCSFILLGSTKEKRGLPSLLGHKCQVWFGCHPWIFIYANTHRWANGPPKEMPQKIHFPAGDWKKILSYKEKSPLIL